MIDLQETAALLAKIQLDDNREITREVIIRWNEILNRTNYTLDELFDALNLYRAESAAYLMPAHLVTNARRIREERSQHRVIEEDDNWNKPGFISDPKPDNFDAMSAAWNDPVRFHAEVFKYRQQIAEYHRNRRLRHEAGINDADLV